jgi:tetrapyrrole methylase family protein / MazG family protein
LEYPRISLKERLPINTELVEKINLLINLIETLRGKNGCPWDQKQTPRSMSVYLIEEMYELVEAIIRDNKNHVCEELGDVIFHILFLTSIYKEKGEFSLEIVVDQVTEKMIRRHPHVFGNTTVENVEDVKKQWHHIKQSEKNDDSFTSVLSSVPKSLPALIRAYQISDRAARTGFDWDDINGVIAKAEEEWEEFKKELASDSPEKTNLRKKSLEFGDVLFTLMNIARFAGIHPETSLAESTNKFEKRFKFMENEILKEGKHINSATKIEMNRLWDKAKEKFQD